MNENAPPTQTVIGFWILKMSKPVHHQRRSSPAFVASTLEDVARWAGVSTATVSRCLNAPAQVAETTRKRVLAAVKELNYAPNFGAKSLAAKRTNTFGAIVPTMENAIFARGLQAFQEELERHGVTLLVASSSYSAEAEEEQIRILIARGADALLLIGQDRTAESYEFLMRRKIPYVLAWSFEADLTHPCTGFDNEKAMTALTEQVLELGHERIAMITAPQIGNDRARARVRGIQNALIAQGREPRALRVYETPYSIPNGAAAFEALMARDPRPTAVMCGNDVLACGALKMARHMGILVPHDVSITGFDDIELAEIVTPSLTTVSVPHRAMGEQAAQKLIALRNGEDPGANVDLPVRVTLRDSLGPAPTIT